MTTYDTIGRTIDKWEGGYSFDPLDAGGETNWGISRRAFPGLDVKKLTKQDAITIYDANYYTPLKCGSISSSRVRWKVFDIGVNAGVYRSAIFLQRVVGAYQDGKIGAETLRALHQHDSNEVMVKLIEQQVRHYVAIIERNPSQNRFLNGWLKRAFDAAWDLS